MSGQAIRPLRPYLTKSHPAFAHKHPGPRLIGPCSWLFALGASFFRAGFPHRGVLLLPALDFLSIFEALYR
jgi:hypothetical protein